MSCKNWSGNALIDNENKHCASIYLKQNSQILFEKAKTILRYLKWDTDNADCNALTATDC